MLKWAGEWAVNQTHSGEVWYCKTVNIFVSIGINFARNRRCNLEGITSDVALHRLSSQAVVMRGRPSLAGDLPVFFSLCSFKTREMTLLDRPTSLDIADKCIPEVCNSVIFFWKFRSHFNMWCRVCRLDTSNKGAYFPPGSWGKCCKMTSTML